MSVVSVSSVSSGSSGSPGSPASPGGSGAPAYRLVRRPRSSDPARLTGPELDESQRRVVEHRGGPLLVLAGPGTGKTTTLVEAAVDRIERDGIEPEHVLLLTFGRRAAAELRDRIAARLDRTIREPLARTFHSYAFGLLRNDAVLNDLPVPRLLAGPEQDLMIRDLLRGDVEEFGAKDWPTRLRPALGTRGFAQELRDLLLRAAERGIEPPGLGALGRQQRRDDWRAAARFARQYAAITALRPETPAYDPAELVRAAVDLLRADPELLARERANRAVVFVDEYQDTDPAQEELLRLLAGGGRELVVVGDPDQSIYAFRGADSEAIRRFTERFPTVGGTDAPTVALTRSRRAGATLLKASRRITDRLGGPPAHRRLVAEPGSSPGEVQAHLLHTRNQEASFVAQRLREAHLVDGVEWSRMAVLVRAASYIPLLRRSLAAAGVPATVRLEETPLVDQPAVRPLLTVLSIATERTELTSEETLDLLVSPYGGADALALRRLRQELRRSELAAGGKRSSTVLLVEALADPRVLIPLDPAATAPARRIGHLLTAAVEAVEAPNATAETVLWAVWSAGRVSDRWARRAASGGPGASAADRDLDAVTALFDMVARFVDRMPAAGPAVFLDHLLGQEIPADTLAPRAPEGDTVTVLTAHASKGLEWDVVAVVGVQEGVWPDLRLRGSLLGSESLVDLVAGRDPSPVVTVSHLLAEERRLFYVAVTRARRRLIVTAVSSEETHPSRFVDELVPWSGPGEERPLTRVPRGLELAAVVAELRSVVCAPGNGTGAGTGSDEPDDPRRLAAAHQLARLAAAGIRGADPAEWYAVAPLTDDAPLRGPEEQVRVSPSKVEAFARCALRWLLESCGGNAGDLLSQGVGTLVHDLAYDVAIGAVVPDEIMSAFETRWARLDSGTGWHSRRQHEHARTLVERLSGWLRSNPRELAAAEETFAVEVGRAVLSGRVDRLERDAEGRLVVVDLKTGKSKPVAADLPMHPQLGAYQLAVEQGGFERGPEEGTADGPGDGSKSSPEDGAEGGPRSGGAVLVQLGSGSKVTEQSQPPLSGAEDPKWAQRLVEETAEGMAAADFDATENRWCGVCPSRRSCPLHVEGGQVTP
ncbi:ATP-dependent helicase [Actinopolymorpha cephalotaxi]|uniref:DNA 3'-5' helicase n=1 Tax=Actinopolymorpha cephalotaxi TaxID=504797 RepID=A0ABX2S074_9ACTN|nr:ATP-dependent DNA helicase [Actinopolymorpha cephalotaxi]NYH81792.1 superfamily I DNA/RNA helicase/RecB family exonuclease [Actinopolymorpha cephalotaxi]